MTTNYDHIPMPSDDDVQQLLDGVFDACDMTPNDVSLKKLSRRAFFRRRMGSLRGMLISLFGLACLIVIPLILYFNYSSQQQAAEDAANEQIAMTETDTAPPHVVDDYEEDGYIYLILEDYSEIDYSTLRIVTESDTELDPAFVDEENQTICLSYPTETITIYISDELGNEMEVIISAK